ncbi:Protein of unknown function [Pyronema omphalodes CBS 100304]|uniref:Uncharacterized protein n=1 Tax=Pyronema omphalodes (strain CBS 100304) TaxID=1076935 RepID=U4LGK7_PYROM|nr:Protein of unknown function [Pyronema omphalodes CBS 100304]
MAKMRDSNKCDGSGGSLRSTLRCLFDQAR